MSYNIVQEDGILKNISGVKSNFKAYTSLEDLSLDAGCTIVDIITNMENKSSFVVGTTSLIGGDDFGNVYIADMPVSKITDEPESGILSIIKVNDSRYSITFRVNDDITMYTGSIYRSEVTWNRVATETDIESQRAYKHLIDNSRYAQIGVQNGSDPGYLRLYNKPKKIVVIGNSITMHGRREADGIEWTVDDMREMAAQYPNSGWVGLIKRYIGEYVNPDCEVWKANGSTWEVQANGTRDYSHLADQKVAQVFDDGPNYRPDLTIDDILDEDVDIIIIQLSENCATPDTDDAIHTMTKDFGRLYAKLAKKAPNAKIYQFCGFWQVLNKVKAMVGACYHGGVVPIQPLTLLNNFHANQNINMQSSVGTEIYDSDGNVIATVSAAVAGHPGDDGFNVMATYVINALYNEITVNSNQRILLFARTSKYDHPILTEFYNVDNAHRDDDDFSTLAHFNSFYSQYTDFFLTPGKIPFTAHYKRDTHGLITIDAAELPGYSLQSFKTMTDEEISKLNFSAYIMLCQTYTSVNSYDELERKIVLSGDNTKFMDFMSAQASVDEYVVNHESALNKTFLGEQVHSFCWVFPEDTKLVNNNWTTLFSFRDYGAHVPKHVLSFKILGDTSAEILDIHSGSDFRFIIMPSENVLKMAAPTTSDVTYKKGRVLVMEYTAR